MLSYEIVVHCICGQLEKYTLSALNFSIAIIGRKQEAMFYPHIGLCSDDKPYFSSASLYFAYDQDEKDWIIGNGFPDKKYWHYDKRIEDKITDNDIKSKRTDYIYTTSVDTMDELLSTKINQMLNDKKQECTPPYKNAFSPLKNKKILKLSEIAGVGIFPVDEQEKDSITYKNNKHLGIKHLILPDLPFHWYIEIKNNRSNTIAVKSYIEKTKYLSKI